MIRVDRLFLTLWALVYSLLIIKVYDEAMTYVSKEQVLAHHVVGVTLPMVNFVDNRDQMASVIAHELAHIQLGHTLSGKHNMVMEYNADLLSIYYLKKAGFGVCGAHQLWTKMRKSYTELKPTSHPNYFTRAYYMDMPECNGVVKKEFVSLQDTDEIFKKLNKHVAGPNRYRTRFELNPFTNAINAYAGSRFEDKK